MDNNRQFIYEFEGYIFDEIRQGFFYRGVEIRLAKRNFDVLSLLIKKAGHVIDKQEFHETVWADTFVEDGSLAVAINSLRKVFETHSGKSFIETYPRRGYKFTGQVKKLYNQESEQLITSYSQAVFADLDEEIHQIKTKDIHKSRQPLVILPKAGLVLENNPPKTEISLKNNLSKDELVQKNISPEKLFKRKLFLAFGILFITILGVLGFFYYQKKPVKKEVIENPKIVIFPFKNFKPDPKTDYLGEAFSERISNNLSTTASYDVIYADGKQNSQDINQSVSKYTNKNKVNLAIVGNYSVLENEVEISAKLINTSNNVTIFDRTFKVPNQDISTIPQLIAGEIVAKLGLSNQNVVDVVLDPEHINEEAYRNYLKARVLERDTRYVEAIQFAKKTVETAPNFYNGWILLGYCYMIAGKRSATDNDYYEQAIEVAQKAKKLDPNNPQAGILLAMTYTDTNSLEDALREYKNLPQNEMYQAARLRLGAIICRYGGLLDESISFSQTSLKLNPNTKIFQPELYFKGEYEAFKQSVPISSEPTYYSFFLGLAGIYQNDLPAMKNHFQISKTFFGEDFYGKISEAILLHTDGKTEEGLKILQQLDKNTAALKNFDGFALYQLVIAYVYLGDNEGAIRVFRKTVNTGFLCYPYFLHDPLLNKLREDQRFQQILELARQKHLRFRELYYSEKVG